jgi:hypothetical protein
MNLISLKSAAIITAVAIVGILVVKYLVNRFPVPEGIKSTVNAV